MIKFYDDLIDSFGEYKSRDYNYKVEWGDLSRLFRELDGFVRRVEALEFHINDVDRKLGAVMDKMCFIIDEKVKKGDYIP